MDETLSLSLSCNIMKTLRTCKGIIRFGRVNNPNRNRNRNYNFFIDFVKLNFGNPQTDLVKPNPNKSVSVQSSHKPIHTES